MFYGVFAVSKNYDRIDLNLPHDAETAKNFIRLLGGRYSYSRETINEKGVDQSDLLVFANKTGAILFNQDLAIRLAYPGNAADSAAKHFEKFLAINFYDGCLVDVFSYYENGQLRRHVKEMDGDDQDDIRLEGEMLAEEIAYVKSMNSESYSDSDYFSQYEIDGKIYIVEGWVPMTGAGLEVAKRFVDVDPFNIGFANSSVFAAKPWWKRW